jgi:hypothetical protein
MTTMATTKPRIIVPETDLSGFTHFPPHAFQFR